MNNNTLYIEVDVYGGSEIVLTCRDLCELATRMGISVWASFNGKRVLAQPDDKWEMLVAAWYLACSTNKAHVSAADARQPHKNTAG